MSPKHTIGDQELALLRWITERGSVTLREAVEGFGLDASLARSTVLTMMERLRKKKHLGRKRVGAVFRYSSSVTATELLTGAVRDFVEKTLGGSVSPVVAYLSRARRLSDGELDELQKLVQDLKAQRNEEQR